LGKGKNVRYLGMLALGGFVGGFLILGIEHTKGLDDFQKLLATVFGAAFTGAVSSFISYLRGDRAGSEVYLYPVGLLLALMWAYGRVAVDNISSKEISIQFLGWSHMLGLVVINVLAVALVLNPAVSEIWKEKVP
jgi:hypothetical protein